MRKSKLFLLMFLAIFAACKKTGIEQESRLAGDAVDQMKKWYGAQKKPGNDLRRDEGHSLPTGTVDWEKMRHYPEMHLYVFPYRIKSDNKFIDQYLLIYDNERGEFIKCELAFIRLDARDREHTIQILPELFPGIFELEHMPDNVTASVIKLDLFGNRISSIHIDRSVVTESDERLVGRPAAVPANYVPIPQCQDGQTCTDWYWQTWVNGQLVYEEYLFTTCDCIGGTGGGGGGLPGPTGPCNLSPEQAQAILNNVQVEDIDIVESTIGNSVTQFGQIRQPKNSTWRFARITLDLSPYGPLEYAAKFTGIRYKSTTPHELWKWQNFEYNNTVLYSGIVPPCTSISLTPSVSYMISGDELSALIQLDYTAIITITCPNNSQVGQPINRQFNKSIYAM